jgi:hypothetical protein
MFAFKCSPRTDTRCHYANGVSWLPLCFKVAQLLASLCSFGLMSYKVARRTNEIGIRMALGAEKRNVVGMVLRESAIMVAMGIGIGLIAALDGPTREDDALRHRTNRRSHDCVSYRHHAARLHCRSVSSPPGGAVDPVKALHDA